MSALDSWEDDQDAQEDLSKRTQQVNLNNPQAGVFHPGASSFQPGAATFQPQVAGYQQQQYGGYIPQQQQQGGYGRGYPQYGGQGYGQGYGYSQPYNQGAYMNQNGLYGQQQQQQQQQQQYVPQTQTQQGPPQQQVPRIAKRPSGQDAPSSQSQKQPAAPTPPSNGAPTLSDSKPKVLSLSTDPSAAPKVESSGPTKVLSIGTPSAPTPAKKDTGLPPQQAARKESVDGSAPPTGGNKVAAAKAIEKTGEPTPTTEKTPASSADKPATSPNSSGRNSPTPQTPQEKRQAAREADAVAKEQAADVDDETLREMYGKEHVNVIFLGHVDAGKSTLGGSILYATGMVDERTMDKYKREAKEAGRETWYLSWALDLTKEERSKGKTVEVGRGFFETEKRRYSILDAPGHKNFVPNMIGGASQADVGILVISARKGEYETGFERGGQTREHAMLAKTQGVNKLVVAVNKMDDPTVEWSKERYEECLKKLTVFLKGLGYNPKTDIMFMPISAQTTQGIKAPVRRATAPWYDGPSLLDYLDSMQSLERKVNAPFMMPIAAKYRDMGTMIEGKIESGVIKKGVAYLMMPNREQAAISALYGETEDEVDAATCGDQVRVKLRNIEEEDVLPGFVLCSPKRPVHCVRAFEAQVVLLELKTILSAGFDCVMHVHSATEEVTFARLLHKLEKGTGRKSKKPPGFATKGMSIIARLEVTGGAMSVCVERFDDYPQLGRFTLRDQGQTIAIGKITRLITDPSAAAAAAAA